MRSQSSIPNFVSFCSPSPLLSLCAALLTTALGTACPPTQPTDAGVVVEDAGTNPDIDAGNTENDAGNPTPDAGGPVDSGTPVDSGEVGCPVFSPVLSPVGTACPQEGLVCGASACFEPGPGVCLFYECRDDVWQLQVPPEEDAGVIDDAGDASVDAG